MSAPKPPGPAAGSSAAADAIHTKEFKVRIPARNKRKSFHIMKFNATMKVDPQKWKHVRMVRENNRKEMRQDEDLPKSGAGSEFGRLEREEARRKKFGMKARVYNPDAQPWLMRVGNKKEGKTYRGLKEGGVNDNATYYVFTNAADGSFEAHPVKEWYNFTPKIQHKTLGDDEAEEKFEQRGKILNHWALTVHKRLKPDAEVEEDDHDGEGKKGKKAKAAKKDLKISDMDDWVESGDELDSESDEEADEEGAKKKEKKKKEDKSKDGKRSKDSKKKSRKKSEADLEGFEDSDDGDDEGREVDYMSDESSDSEDELLQNTVTKGVDQDEGLAKMLDSDFSDDEEEDKKSDDEDDEEDDPDRPKKKKEEEDGEEGDKTKKKKKSGKGSKNSSRATTPTPEEAEAKEKASKAEKRKTLVDNVMDLNGPGTASPAKKSRMDGPVQASSSASSSSSVSRDEAVFEEEVRKYLLRKPMTTTEILKKIKSKRTGINKDELMPMLVKVLKRINPHKNLVRGVMFLSIKN